MNCTNCGYAETEDAAFCSICGQRFGPGKLTIGQFLKDLIDHVFALETTFFRTLGKIFIPGQLTIDYFKGLRKRYYHPLRLFFVLLVVHLGVLGSLIPYDTIFNEISNRTNEIITKHQIRTQLDKLSVNHSDQISMQAMDSIKAWFDIRSDTMASTNNITRSHINLFGYNNVLTEDVILLTNDSLASKYNIKNYWLKLAYRQSQKFSLDPKGMIQFILGNISWMMIVMIPLLAFMMMLLFWRKSRFYIEHLFFLYHWHAFAFLLGTLLVFCCRNYLLSLIVPFFVLIILFGMIAWKRYYKQGWIKTIIKFFTMGLSYVLLFALLLSMTAAISFGFY